jgi:AAA+ ATPase superfamily predicted ATPase
LLTENVFNENEILDFVLSENSPFLYEGKNVLIEKFGKEYGIYFSILELIASGKTSRTEIESILQKEVGVYLERLEKFYGVLEKFRPIDAKPQARMVKYRIKDIFLRFWFRFLYRNWSAIETSNFLYIRQVMEESLSTYKGGILEEFFRNLFAESHQI